MSKKKEGHGNYGIQARSVKAGAIAIGKGASVSQNFVGGGDIDALRAALDELQDRLSRSDLPPEALAVLEEDIHAITAESERDNPDTARLESILKSLASKIKLTANLAKSATDLIEPARKIAAAIGVAAAAIGLL